MKKILILLIASLIITGCGSGNGNKKLDFTISSDEIITDYEKDKEKVTTYENYYNPKENSLIKDKVSGFISSVYYDFDKDGEVEYLISSVKDNDIILTLYEYEDKELKEYDSLVLFEKFLDFPDTITMNCFIKNIDDEIYIFAESVGYSNLVGDGINWNFKKIGFSNGKFWNVASDGFSGSYFENDYIKAKKDFVKGTSLSINKFEYEDGGKMLYEQNKDKALNFFTIKRVHLKDFDQSLYYDSSKTKVKYGETSFDTDIESDHNLETFIK